MTDRELLQDALDALTYVGDAKDIYSGTIDALRARLAQPEQEPVLVNHAINEEREACAALCFQMWNTWMDSEYKSEFTRPDAEDCAAQIRARGQV